MEQYMSQEEIRKNIINDMVRKRNMIVPIIGDDMVVYKGKDDSVEIPFQEFLVREFQRKYPNKIVNDKVLSSMKGRGYYGLALLSQEYNIQGRFLDDFIDFINNSKSYLKLRDEVKEFLAIFDFPIIITTICFDIIEQQLKDDIHYKSVWYTLNMVNSTLPMGCVYHIFGQAKDGSKWVFDEDMLLTFLLSHNDKDKGAIGLINYLKENEKKLFVLGCNLPNWLFRFLWKPIQIQTSKNSELKTTQGYWINKDRPEDSFDNFLKKKNFSSDEQVKEILVDATKLMREEIRCEQEKCNAVIDNDDHFDVFISYASEDRKLAVLIYDELKNINIKAWLDDRGKGEIRPGDPYWEKIQYGIRHSDHFMPIITGNWMNKMTNTSSLKEETNFVRNWLDECSKADSKKHLKRNYSIPVIIKGSVFNDVDITVTSVEQIAGLGVLPYKLFKGIDMIMFDGHSFIDFEKIAW